MQDLGAPSGDELLGAESALGIIFPDRGNICVCVWSLSLIRSPEYNSGGSTLMKLSNPNHIPEAPPESE